MRKEEQGITTIKYGELHMFYPIRFEKNISIEELYDRIKESSIVFKEEYEQEILSQLGNDMHRFTEEWNKEHGQFMQMRVVDYEKALDSDTGLSDIRKDDLRIEVYEQDNKLYYRLVSEELDALQERCKQMQEEYERSLKIYGSNFTDVQERFLLLPLKVTLYNQKQVWMHPFLYLFSNHMAILKLELPLINVSTDELKNYKINNYILGTTCTWEEDVESFATIEEIQKFYKNKIFTNNIEFVATEDVFRHMILTDFENMPTHVNSLSNAIQEDIFRIVSAPAPNIPASIRKDAEELLKNYSWGGHNIKCVLKSTGGCFSFIDKELLEYCSQIYLDKTFTILDEMDKQYLANKLVRDIEFNVEFAILIIILKKLNQHMDLWEKQYNDKDLTKIRKEFFENSIFITSLQECCYGSVSEQVRDFEKMLPYYMKTDLMNEKLNAVERIRTIQEKEKLDKLQQFIATGGFLFSVIFGLPSIYDALGIVRKCCSFIRWDIPIVSQLNLSVILWLCLNIWLCLNLFEGLRNLLKKIGNLFK